MNIKLEVAEEWGRRLARSEHTPCPTPEAQALRDYARMNGHPNGHQRARARQAAARYLHLVPQGRIILDAVAHGYRDERMKLD